jgi:UDP-N-acetylmuramoylalanine--D-glutamate ligase
LAFPAKFTAAGVPLVGETEFAFNLTDMQIAAITGTNGKSTCTELIAALFNGCGMKSIPCGNHGMSLSEVVASGVRYDVLALRDQQLPARNDSELPRQSQLVAQLRS